MEFGKGLQKVLGGVNLDAAIKDLPGIGPLKEENWYRFHGEAGLEDFKKTGTVRAKPNGKYTSTYFSEGTAESRYQRKGSGSVVVAHAKEIDKVPDTRRYGITPQLEKGKSRFQVFEKVIDKAGEVKYKSTYDNLSASKYYGRKVLASGGVVGPGLEALLYSSEVGEGSDKVQPDNPLTEAIKQRRITQEESNEGGLWGRMGGGLKKLLETAIPDAGAAEPNRIQRAIGMTEAPTGVSMNTQVQLNRLEEEDRPKEKPKPTVREDKGLSQKDEFKKVMGEDAAERKKAKQEADRKKLMKGH